MTFSSIISFPRPYDTEGAPGCGIYLTSPTKIAHKMLKIQIRSAFTALNSSRYQKNMHALELKFPKKILEKERQEASELVAMCHGAGIVPIIRDDVGLCVESGADGVILSDIKNVEMAKKALGPRAIIGFDCGNSRDAAEKALALGVDYVTFSKFFSSPSAKKSADISLLEWWSSATELPAAAFGNLDVNRVIKLTKAGAGFIGAGSWVWEHDEGPGRAIHWLQAAIEHGLGSVKVN